MKNLCICFDPPIKGSCSYCGDAFYLYYEYQRIGNVCDRCESLRKSCESYISSGKYLPLLDKAKSKRRCVTEKIRNLVFARDGFKCVRCGTNYNLVCDHVIPYKSGGVTSFENLQTLCQNCNRLKSDKIEVGHEV